MSKEIINLDPKAIWTNFYKLTQIPRPSKKESRIIKFMEEWGKSLGLDTFVDQVGNVIIKKPATPGMEDRKTVVLQGHLDMVPQKNSDIKHDFEKDPIDAYIDGDWVTARGTTLGADNGIGDAATMSVLESKDLEHGPIIGLFTIDEETGMTGAFGLKPNLIDADILINLDSEEEGELCVGCAGGTNANIKFNYSETNVTSDVKAFKLSVTGLKGGHSGVDIKLERGNSNKILIRFLKYAVKNYGLRLSSIEGGSLRNAIPREAFAVVTVPNENEKDFVDSVSRFEKIFKKELSVVEPDLSFKVKTADMPASLIDEKTQNNMINAVYGCPNGVIRMSDSMPGLVETSTSLAIVKSYNGEITVQCLLRSSVDTAKEDLCEMMGSIFELAGAEVDFSGTYPGWKPNVNSSVLKQSKEVYNNMFGKIPDIKAIHAGLECGLLGGIYPNWDMISFGPTIRYPHSPDEKVNIKTVDKFWKFLIRLLKEIPKK